MPKKVSAKERILETASRLFQERGFKEVGINEIIEKSGTAKATFYSNFKSKEALGEAWLQQIHDLSELQRASLLENLEQPVKVLDSYFKGLEKFLKEGKYRGCPYTNTAAVLSREESCLQRQVYDHKNSIRDFFRQLSKHEIADSKAADLLGDRIFLLYSGATTECQNLQEVWPVGVALSTSKKLWKDATS